MPNPVGSDVRKLVAERAGFLCEYCLIAETDTFYGCQVDHIISLKHGGSSEDRNLAYACALCNRAKGSDIGSLSSTGQFTRFYHPRNDRWSEHFALSGVNIVARSEIGEVTVRLLGFNDESRLHERQAMASFGKYPSAAALAMIAT